MGPSSSECTPASSNVVGRPWQYSRAELFICLIFPVTTYFFTLYEMYNVRARFLAPGALDDIRPGLFGILMDDSDRQWRIFRQNALELFVVALIHISSVRVLRALRVSPSVQAALELLFGLAGLTFLHGAGLLFVIALALGNFLLSRLSCSLRAGSVLHRLVPTLAWGFNLFTLLISSSLSRLAFSDINPHLASLDLHRGFMRWSVPCNLLVLRMISFTIDHHRACAEGADTALQSRLLHTDQMLAETHRPRDRYSLLNYFAFLFYLPLYIAGPISSFNAWQAQMEHPQTEYSRKDLVLYSLRVAFNLVLLQHLLHTSFSNAICANIRRHHAEFATFTPFQIIAFSFICVYFLWLKFAVIWQSFRLWALVGGVLTTENMTRFVYDNYSCVQFWRSWHRSFNLWLIRYMYLPMGGNKRRLLNSFIIFNFVAIWHDLEWRLLHWAWCIVLILLPETALTWLFSGPRFLGIRSHPYYRFLCTIGWSCNIFMLLFGNLVGFTYGLDGLHLILDSWWHHSSLLVNLWWVTTVVASCNLMLYLRYGRQGKLLKY
eukprot:GGOE01011412.1.p1 GENE.GGOE01011412.1~~GGOE01011412.1.p1  ORF type:complete len:548 (-),score=107.24 GGOE01011412.1:392-2035(-)